MAKKYSGGVPILTPFKMNDPQPIVDYMVVDLIADLAELPNQFIGMETYVLEDQNKWIKKASGWVLFEGNQDNKIKPIYIYLPEALAIGENEATYFNKLASFTVNPDEIPLVVVAQDVLFSGGGFTVQIKHYFLKLKGKGVYGFGGTPILLSDLILISSTNAAVKDIAVLPSTQTIDLGDISGQEIKNVVNVKNPAILIQEQNIGYRLFETISDGKKLNYLFKAIGGLYGFENLQTSDEDFQLFGNNNTTNFDPIVNLNFNGVFDLTNVAGVYYNDYKSETVLNLSLSETKKTGSTATVRIEGGKLGIIPNTWSFTGEEKSELVSEWNELTVLYVKNEDIRIVNRVIQKIDEDPPTVPENLTAKTVGGRYITFSWQASIDNNNVKYYNIYINSVLKKTSTSTVTTVDSLEPLTSYNIQVSAVDKFENESPRSSALTVTTLNLLSNILPNLNTWLDPADHSSLDLTSESIVNTITDKGSSKTLTSVQGKQTLIENTIVFNGSGSYQTTASPVLAPSSNFHGFFIFKDINNRPTYDMITNRISASSRFTLAIKAGILTVGTYNGSSFNCKSIAFTDTSSFHKLEFKNILGVVTASLDGVVMTGTVAGTTGLNEGFRIGASDTELAAHSDFILKEFIVNNGEMTTTQRNECVSYLLNKHSI